MPDRTTLRRILAFVTLGLLAGLWLIARPAVLERWSLAWMLEFPIGLAVVALLAWLAMRPARTKERPESPWQRHEQVVRPLADPDAAPLQGALDAWVEHGESPGAAADVLARALETDPDLRERARARISTDMAEATSRRKREALLRRVLETPDPDVPFTAIDTHERTGA